MQNGGWRDAGKQVALHKYVARRLETEDELDTLVYIYKRWFSPGFGFTLPIVLSSLCFVRRWCLPPPPSPMPGIFPLALALANSESFSLAF